MMTLSVAATRTNFMKIAPIMEAFHAHPNIDP